jgi:hypothetical protein
MVVLIIAQLFLAAKQIKRKAPDGKILLIIDMAVIFVWTPLSVFKFITDNLVVKIVWFVISVAYMGFTMWYTNMMQKSFKK